MSGIDEAKENPLTLDANEVEALLGDLCMRLGFCLPPDEYQRLAALPPTDINGFTDAVFVAEGLNSSTADRMLYKQVRETVSQAFARNKSNV